MYICIYVYIAYVNMYICIYVYTFGGSLGGLEGLPDTFGGGLGGLPGLPST